MANCGWPCAASLSPSRLGDHCPGRLVEIGVEAGQHQRAVRQLGDGGEQCRGRRDRAGRACRDHRAGAGLKPFGFGRDQLVAALGRLDAASLLQERRPVLARMNFRKSSVFSQYSSMSAGTRLVEPVPAAPAASPCRPSAGRDRWRAPAPRPGCWRSAARGRRRAARSLSAHFRMSLRERHGARKPSRARPADRAPRRRSRRSRLRRRQARPRRRRRSARCAAGSRRRV